MIFRVFISVELTNDVAYYILKYSIVMLLSLRTFHVRKSNLKVNFFPIVVVWVREHVKY